MVLPGALDTKAGLVSNVNPRHLAIEPNDANQTRKGCAEFCEKWWFKYDVGEVPAHWGDHECAREGQARLQPFCSVIHNPCMMWDPAWGSRDFLEREPFG